MIEDLRKRIIFLHIHKCGGLTLQRIFRRNFGYSLPRRALHRLYSHLRPKGQNLLEDLKNSQAVNRYLMGHFCFGIHKHLPGESQYVTMLRQPVERLKSLYVYSRNNPDAYYYQEAQGIPFFDFVDSGRVLETDNGMVRFLSGDEDPAQTFINRREFGSISKADLEKAIENIENSQMCVGFLEEFDTSLMLFADKLKLKRKQYFRINEASNQFPRPTWDDRLASYTKYDQALYDYLYEKFFQDFVEGDSFDLSQLESFKRKNAAYQYKWGSAYNKYAAFKVRIRELEAAVLKSK